MYPPDTSIAPSDKRLLLAKDWLERSPGAQDVFAIWEGATSNQTSVLALVVSVLAAVLNLLSSHYTFHGLGYPIIKALLAPQCTRKLNSFLAGSHNDLILVTLKLFNSISAFASGRERKNVLESFAWETKVGPYYCPSSCTYPYAPVSP